MWGTGQGVENAAGAILLVVGPIQPGAKPLEPGAVPGKRGSPLGHVMTKKESFCNYKYSGMLRCNWPGAVYLALCGKGPAMDDQISGKEDSALGTRTLSASYFATERCDPPGGSREVQTSHWHV